jgi:phenylacetate-CoA ligase
VPHYRETLGRAGEDTVVAAPLDALSTLPIMTKLDVQDAGTALLATRLPAGDRQATWTQTSGTTAKPTRVLHSMLSTRMFAVLKQRENRWWRFDPAGKFAAMRLPENLPRRSDGKRIEGGEVARMAHWPYMEAFATGPFAGISATLSVEERVRWLREERPDYLMAMAETLELVAFAAGKERPADSLKACISISEQLTPSMRRFVEQRFQTPVHQNYGLNEIGLVAIRCDAGRYHVHTEHCHVEIVDHKGGACAAGATGRIVVTSLTNFAMPLIRYDTGDLAEATENDCPCGRTLPSFGDIVGRYARVAYLPPGTAAQVNALREALEKMPADLARDLREFQIHQRRDRRFELRLVARAPLPKAFYDGLRAAWAALSANGPALEIFTVDRIPRCPGGKSEVFTSDFIPARDTAGAAPKDNG